MVLLSRREGGFEDAKRWLALGTSAANPVNVARSGSGLRVFAECPDADGARWTLEQLFTPANGNAISVESRFTVNQDRSVVYLPLLQKSVTTIPAFVIDRPQNGITLSGTTLAFGNQNGLTSDIVTLTVGGTVPVTFQTAAVTNAAGQNAFSKGADSCSGTTKNPGDTCTITVNFNGPNGNNARSGTLSVPYTGAGGSPVTLSLTGS